jgi:hypothetical protein
VTWLARTVFALLICATFGAFFVAQRLKGAPQVVQLRGIVYFSPNGDGRHDLADVSLRMRQSDVVTADIVDPAGDAVRRVASARTARAGHLLHLVWNGRDDNGRRAPDGDYRVRLSLSRQGRSIVVPRLLHLDTTAPRPRVTGIAPSQVVGPKTPPMRITVRGISRRHATRFRVVRTDLAQKQLVAKGSRAPGLHRWVWDGKVNGAPAPPGVYVVQVAVMDRAGNVGRTPSAIPPPPGERPTPSGITVRSLAAQPPLRPVTAGKKASFFVDSRRRAYRWDVRRVGARRPVRRGKVAAAEAKPLRIRAPQGRSGLYVLELQAGRTQTQVPFLVQAATHADVLVVVPAITWLGTDPVDDPPVLDGIPDLLTQTAGHVRWPRVFAGEDGLPPGFKREVAPLLRFLDGAGIRYDLTSDLDLTLSSSPRASDRKGVLLAGSEQWVTRGLARRLRRYALDGGRVATFGVQTLRRGVSLETNGSETGGELVRPTQESAEDPFGAKLGSVDRGKPEPVQQLAGDPAYGLLTGFDGTLDGFSAFEESSPPASGTHARVLVALGRGEASDDAPAALTATKLGDGLVIRVGLPQWPRRLADPEVSQLTRNIVDLLRGVQPKIRSAP